MKAASLIIYVLLLIWVTEVWGAGKVSPVEEVSDSKQLKQLLRTRTNVLVLFTRGGAGVSSVLRTFKEAATEVRGIGTLVTIDCSGQGQKLCRQLKASPDPYVMHHYKDGKFHKVYDRQSTTKSIVRFMNDPTGDIPWEEEPNGKSVVHLDDPKSLTKLLKKHKRVLVMFYAPWCVYCKQMKPEFAAAATSARTNNIGVLAAMDVVRTENAGVRTKYNITGFPTVHYFKNGEILATYEGDNKQDKIIEFLKDPTAAPMKEKEIPWSEESSEVHHLTTENFNEFIKANPSTLVMFYAPWCGHCKNLKPEWVKAASACRSQQIAGVLAAVDATKETSLAEKFKVKGFPTIKYFKNGELAFDTPNLRDSKKILDFMKDPKEPPPPPPPEPNWADIPSEVVHLTEENFKSQLRSKRHALIMFYAPWCGHCKAAKPHFEEAADHFKEESRVVLGAVNCVDHPAICKLYEVKGYPTFKHFKYQKEVNSYDGGRKAADFIKYLESLEPDLKNQIQADIISKPSSESSTESKQIPPENSKTQNKETAEYQGWNKLVHITEENYQSVLSKHKSLLVMFYNKSCGSCNKMKSIFGKLVENDDQNVGVVAACNTEECPRFARQVAVETVPTVKLFLNGQPVGEYKGEQTVSGLTQFLATTKTIKKDEL